MHQRGDFVTVTHTDHPTTALYGDFVTVTLGPPVASCMT